MTLRSRLLLSHTAVIVAALMVLAIALYFLLAQLQSLRNPADLVPEVLRLSRVARAGFAAGSAQSAFDRAARLVQSPRRLLLLEADGTIVDDSSQDPDALPTRAQLDVRQRALAAGGSGDGLGGQFGLPRESVASGEFRDVRNRRWEYVAFALRPNQSGSELFAIARPATSGLLFDVLEETVAMRLLVAGGIALVVAGVIAALVARSLSQPIQRVAAAANAIARGHYDERVALKGPIEFHQLADDFNSMASAVQAARRRERDFLANVTHELKTPLTSIQGFAQAIADGTVQDGEAARGAAGVIFEESERLRRMVGGLLDASRIEAGEARLSRVALNVNDVLRACVTRFDLRAKDARVNLTESLGDVAPVHADGDRLAQVFMNLLDNGLKFTPPGGSVLIESRPAPREGAAGVEVVVSDTGLGIAAADLPKIFDRFFQAEGTRAVPVGGGEAGGVGLGLTISKQIVEAHGGTIAAASVPGAGTRISVWLPA